MPVTPAPLTCFLEAPVPFVLGWQYKTHDVSTRYGQCVPAIVAYYKSCLTQLGSRVPHDKFAGLIH